VKRQVINLYMIKWVKERLKHKWEHVKTSGIKEMFAKHGLALVVIFIGWEILEDVLFPLLFIWLGNNVNPWFHTGAPISWILCLHPVAVPAIWWLWMKSRGKKIEKPLDIH